MAALQCEICGGKLTAKSGGLFECEYCGMQYDKTRIQEMVQEIKGTVKVEGTVQVTGTVKLDGPVEVKGSTNVEGLLKRGWMAIEDRQYDEAKNCFNQALQMDSELGQAYFGIAMATVEYNTVQRLAETADFRFKQYIERARKYADEKTLTMLQEYDTAKTAKKQRMEAKEEEERARKEAAYLRKKQMEEVVLRNKEQIHKRAEILRQRITSCNTSTLAIQADGTLLSTGGNKNGQLNVSGWHSLKAVAASDEHTIGLKENGTVVACGNTKTGCCDVMGWQNIVKIATCDSLTVGLKEDGRVTCTTIKGSLSNFGQSNVYGWRDIQDIAVSTHATVGIRKDGKLVYCGNLSRIDDRIERLSDFVSVDIAENAFIALRSNGEVVMFNPWTDVGLGQWTKWTDIVQVAAGYDHVVGLKADGTVMADGKNKEGECNVSKWQDIVAVCATFRSTVGLKQDGTILQAGLMMKPVSAWRLFQNADTLEEESVKAKAVAKEKLASKLQREKQVLSIEMQEIQRNLFAGKRRREIEARLAEIETELKGL